MNVRTLMLVVCLFSLEACDKKAREERLKEQYAQRLYESAMKQGEAPSAEEVTPILTKRALDEVSRRIPSAQDKQARTRVSSRVAVVVVSYTMLGKATRQEQEIQFFYWDHKWDMTWTKPPQ
jgi:hypothetical protein